MTLPTHLHEAQRLLDAGLKLVPLEKNSKAPAGNGWNNGKNYVTEIHPKATGYGIHLAPNNLCSIDPDNVELARIGMAALGFNLDDIMDQGVRTRSTRPGSGGRSTFQVTPDLFWIRFTTKDILPGHTVGTGIVLELRARSDNLHDCVPGVQYYDKDSDQICTQEYHPHSLYEFDCAPELPPEILSWWKRMCEDTDFYIEQQTKFFAALGLKWETTNSSGSELYGRSALRMSYNNNHDVEEILERHGYNKVSPKRWSAPISKGSPGIRPIPNRDGLWRSDHGSDVLCGTFDAWTAHVLLDHAGDVDAAERGYQDEGLDEFTCETDDGAVVTGFDALELEARGIKDRTSFKAFAAKVAAVPVAMLNSTDRTMLAGIVAGLKVLDGMTKANIAAALKFTPAKIADHTNRPKYERNEDGDIMNTTGNIVLALSSESELGIRIALDEFTDSIKFSRDKGETWQPFGDKHYTDVQIVLERLGIYGVNTQRVRECVFSVAVDNAIDTAQIWLSGLSWDGVPRVEKFFIDYFHTEDTAYVRAVGRYLWSALAGRVLVPGVQADMIPVLIGKQGVRKSTSIAAMAPAMEFFSELSFGESETESARKMRGCLVGELAELKGINSKDKEHIKAWLTRRFEHWTPKYKEFATTFARRHMFIGSTNTRQFLEEDSTGHRRWLPVDVEGGEVELIERDRDQLWAEGMVLFGECEGICFKEAERLAKFVHDDFIRTDIFLAPIVDYLEEVRGLDGGWKGLGLTTNKIMVDALKLDDARTKPFESARIAEIMVRLGWKITRPRTVDPDVPGKVHRYPTWVYVGETDK